VCQTSFSGLVAGNGLGCVHTSAVTVHTLEVGVTQRSEGRYSPGGVEGEELLQRVGGKERMRQINVVRKAGEFIHKSFAPVWIEEKSAYH